MVSSNPIHRIQLVGRLKSQSLLISKICNLQLGDIIAFKIGYTGHVEPEYKGLIENGEQASKQECEDVSSFRIERSSTRWMADSYGNNCFNSCNFEWGFPQYQLDDRKGNSEYFGTLSGKYIDFWAKCCRSE